MKQTKTKILRFPKKIWVMYHFTATKVQILNEQTKLTHSFQTVLLAGNIFVLILIHFSPFRYLFDLDDKIERETEIFREIKGNRDI